MPKKVFSILFLLIYGTELLAPAWPFFDYFMHKKYIETHLCINRNNPEMHCHGKCYLKKEIYLVLSAENGQSPSDKKKDVPKRVKEFVIRIIRKHPVHHHSIPVFELNKTLFIPYNIGLSSAGYPGKIFRPPNC